MLGERSTLAIVDKWLSTAFMGGRHQLRLDKIRNIESRNKQSAKITGQIKLESMPLRNRLVGIF
jgi:hypothetical protein